MLDAYWWALITMTTVFFFCLSDIKEERLSFSLPLTKFHHSGWLRWHCTNHWSGKGDISQSKSPLPTLSRYIKRQILNKQHIRLLVPCAPSAGCWWLPCPSPSSATTLLTSTRAREGRNRFKRRGTMRIAIVKNLTMIMIIMIQIIAILIIMILTMMMITMILIIMIFTRAALEEKRKEGHITPFGQNLRMDVTELDQGGIFSDILIFSKSDNNAQDYEMVERVPTN